MPAKHNVQSAIDNATPRYKGFSNIEDEARSQLEKMLDGCKVSCVFAAPDIQQAIVRKLRPLAQETILDALEGRTSQEEKYFGYEWTNALQSAATNPVRAASARHLLGSLPEIEKVLKEPVVQQRTALEWLFDQTAGRIRRSRRTWRGRKGSWTTGRTNVRRPIA